MKTHSRLNNLLGALAVHLNDSIRDSTAKAAGHDASAPAALVQIGSFTGESLAQLQAALGTTQSATTRVVQRLRDAGLVRTPINAQDGRGVAVQLREAGCAARADIVTAREHVLNNALSVLSDDDAAQLLVLLEKMLLHLVPNRAVADVTCRLCDVAACPQDSCPAEPSNRVA